MLLSQAAERFIVSTEGGQYSPKYIPTVKSHFKQIIKYLGERHVESLTFEDWNLFLRFLRNEYKPRRLNGDQSSLSEATIDNYLKTIHSFYRWAEEILSIKRVDLKLPRPKYQCPQSIPFSQAEVKRLVDACRFANVEKRNGQKYQFKRPNLDRNKAIILLLIDTGTRAGELSRVRLQDVNLENGEIYIQPYRDGRKSKARTLFIGKKTRQVLSRYISKNHLQPGSSLFGLAPVAIRFLVRRIGENAKVPNAHPHRFRHTFAITYLRNRGNPLTLQKILGHSTLEMSMKYLDIALSDVAKDHRFASPADQWKL
jgi:integrase/recombinase XerD